jgi:FixJ family two-component response regulator
MVSAVTLPDIGSSESPMGLRIRILVAEDDASMRRAIGRLLKAGGYDSIEFESAEALLQSGQAALADCVVSDIHLPTMSGFELVDRLRERCSRLPAVFITAFDSSALREEAARRDRAAYLPKPFEGTALLEAIHRLTICRI